MIASCALMVTVMLEKLCVITSLSPKKAFPSITNIVIRTEILMAHEMSLSNYQLLLYSKCSKNEILQIFKVQSSMVRLGITIR